MLIKWRSDRVQPQSGHENVVRALKPGGSITSTKVVTWAADCQCKRSWVLSLHWDFFPLSFFSIFFMLARSTTSIFKHFSQFILLELSGVGGCLILGGGKFFG